MGKIYTPGIFLCTVEVLHEIPLFRELSELFHIFVRNLYVLVGRKFIHAVAQPTHVDDVVVFKGDGKALDVALSVFVEADDGLEALLHNPQTVAIKAYQCVVALV